MSTSSPVAPSLSSYLAEPIEVGEPDVAGDLSVFPLFGPSPDLDYVAFASAGDRVAITELHGAASVNDLLADNTGEMAALLYEGEEILGAQQDRTLDVSILLDAGTKTRIPVSCVEQGRWDGRRNRERFRPSRQTADPRLRQLKNRRAREAEMLGRAPRADQGEVWREVASRGAELQASSPTGAMNDIYEGRRGALGEIRAGITLHPGQRGSIAAIGGRIEMLDYTGRADVFAALHPAIVEGYALDALARGRGEGRGRERGVDTGSTRGFTELACGAPLSSRSPGIGLGETLRFAGNGAEGSALVHDGELVQLTAFPSNEADADPGAPEFTRGHTQRIQRPSRRRSR